jgi:hypothetical protein
LKQNAITPIVAEHLKKASRRSQRCSALIPHTHDLPHTPEIAPPAEPLRQKVVPLRDNFHRFRPHQHSLDQPAKAMKHTVPSL